MHGTLVDSDALAKWTHRLQQSQSDDVTRQTRYVVTAAADLLMHTSHRCIAVLAAPLRPFEFINDKSNI